MANSVLDAYSNFTQGLIDFVARLKQSIKDRTSVNNVCAYLGISRSMYYQRLNYPQNIDQQVIKSLSDYLQDPELLSEFQRTQQLSYRLAEALTEYLQKARLSIAFISRKIRIHPTTFYRKQKDPRLWKRKQLDQIVHIVETVSSL